MPVVDLERALHSLDRSVGLAKASGLIDDVEVAYGDCSPTPTLDEDLLATLRARHPSIDRITSQFFAANLGSAAGHNALAKGSGADYLLTMNPDVVPAPRALGVLMSVFKDPSVGIAEAKQIPIEHPKDYDRLTGATSWCATAFAIIPMEIFEQLGGFDADTFFLYCDDVDFSWRVRESGRTAVHQPASVVFHDKRLSSSGEWAPTGAERYFAAEAGLLLPYKWGRDDLVKVISQDFERSDDVVFARALASFAERSRDGRLPKQHDLSRSIGQFRKGQYADHRFAL